MRSRSAPFLLLLALLGLGGCAKPLLRPDPSPLPSPSTRSPGTIRTLGFAVQVGAFASSSNALRLEDALRRRGIDAYHFRHESGLFKVRFGDYPSAEASRMAADALVEEGMVDDFFIVPPASASFDEIRRGLVSAARNFMGVPYCWGGDSTQEGFDCSGLTMTVYRLQGLNLPRTSRAQYRAGAVRSMEEIRPGDLVFFATSGRKRPSHVGVYVGDGKFIHAPRQGKTVRRASLEQGYFAETFIGARSYLHD